MGQTVNYVVVPAQLYTQGECKGIHLFIVKIRDEETHELLPGADTLSSILDPNSFNRIQSTQVLKPEILDQKWVSMESTMVF